MKLSSVFIIWLVCSFFSASAQNSKRYYYVEPFKEQEVRLNFNSDSTFKLNDVIGCNQFEYTGRYKMIDNFYVFKSVIYKNLLSSNTEPFQLSDGDTAWIINTERLYIHKIPFKITPTPDVSLQQIRYKKLEEYYIDLLGKKAFLQTFGGGKGMVAAKKKLLECKLPDIKMK